MPRFGLFADVQYADMDDGNTEGRVQRFREAPGKVMRAAEDFRTQEAPLSFVMSLGDLINGNNVNPVLTEQELHLILAPIMLLLSWRKIPTFHVLGNHELRLARGCVLQTLHMPASYYSRRLSSGWTLLVLDSTELSGHHCYPQGSEQCNEAEAFAAAHPATEREPHMVAWNGGLGSRQLKWLQNELLQAESERRHVLVAAHHPISPQAARKTHLAWNWREISAVLVASPAVALVLAGHDHEGGYAFHDGKHWLTMPALLEAPTGSNAYAIVDLRSDKIVIDGRSSTVQSRTLSMPGGELSVRKVWTCLDNEMKRTSTASGPHSAEIAGDHDSVAEPASKQDPASKRQRTEASLTEAAGTQAGGQQSEGPPSNWEELVPLDQLSKMRAAWTKHNRRALDTLKRLQEQVDLPVQQQLDKLNKQTTMANTF
ncbi:hypothetical protein WJX73_010044 [Symbiochloris irregularis]|uniref:Calcineurin-like phosphoesterase domain-containing protein n=1 Tax=Symbiochloris irregularis TaxID=706552 RepID=A0AAW1NX38_9CHLO